MVNKMIETKAQIIKEADEYLVRPQLHEFVEANPKFLRMGESVEVELISPKHEYSDYEKELVHASIITWNEKDYDNFMKFTKKIRKEIMLKAIKNYRLRQFLENFRIVIRISNIPRYMTHQIVRHRRMSFSQEGFRSSDVRMHGVRIPECYGQNEIEDYKKSVKSSFDCYAKMVDSGIPFEEARSVLPMGLLTSIIMSCDLDALIGYLQWRADKNGGAQEEHIFIANKIIEEIKEKDEFAYEILNLFLKF